MPPYRAEDLNTLYQKARGEARRGNFARALQSVETAVQLISEQTPTELPTSIDPAEILALRDALVARQQAEVALWSAAVRLTSSDVPVNEVLSGVNLQMVEHPDVSVDDLNQLMGDLIQVGKVEAVHQELSDPETFNDGVRHNQNLGQVGLAITTALPGFLKDSDALLASKLKTRLIAQLERHDQVYDDLASKLVQQIEMAIKFVEPDIDPTGLLNAYWQLSWCLASGLISEPSIVEEAQATLAKTRFSLSILAKRAAQVFENIRADTDLVYVNRVLDTLWKLNAGLVSTSRSGEADLFMVEMPQLPYGAEMPSNTLKFDDWALEAWSGIVTSWSMRANEGSFLEGTGSYFVGDLEGVGQFARGFLDDLEQLQGSIWPALELPPWQEDSSLGQLEEEASLQLNISSILLESGRLWREEDAIEVLIYLDEQRVQAELIKGLDSYTVWMLETPRDDLRNKYADLSSILVSGVYGQIGDILADQPMSAGQLRDEILIRTPTVDSGEILFEAIYSAAESLADGAMKSGRLEEATLVWGCVYEATQPWSSGQVKIEVHARPGEEVSLLWRKLHRIARRARFKLVLKKRKRGIAASLAILVLLLVVLIGAFQFFGSPGEEDSRGSGLVIPVGIQEITVSQTRLTATDKSSEVFVQETSSARVVTNTEQVGAQMTATEGGLVLQKKRSTAQAVATATAYQGTAIAQTSTATQEALEAEATAEALLCSDASAYALDISTDLVFDPPLGTEYVIGTELFTPKITWEITNMGVCSWKTLDVRSNSEESEVKFSLWREEDKISEITAEDPIDPDQGIKIIMELELLNGSDLDKSWVLVINGLALEEQPRLELNQEEWIIIITPPSSRP